MQLTLVIHSVLPNALDVTLPNAGLATGNIPLSMQDL